MTDLAPAERRTEDERLAFCNLVSTGTPEIEAAVAVGWTRTKLKRQLRDAEFSELVAIAELRRDGAIEKVVYDKALAGDKDMAKYWLNNRQPERWADRRQVDVNSSVQVPVHVTLTVRDAMRELLTEGMDVAQIQHQLHAPVLEAEVIEDSDDG